MRRLLPDPTSSPAGTLQRSPHAVPENSQNKPSLLYSISPALELHRTTGSHSSSRAATSRSRAGSTLRPTAPPPPPPMMLGAIPKKRKTAEEPLPETVAPPVVTAVAQPLPAATSVPLPAPSVSGTKVSFPVHSLTRRSAPSRSVGALRPPVVPRPELFELYKNSLLVGMAAGSTGVSVTPDASKRGAVGRLPAFGSGQLVLLDDVLANRRRAIALSDGDDADY